jgi:hypothetical protein
MVATRDPLNKNTRRVATTRCPFIRTVSHRMYFAWLPGHSVYAMTDHGPGHDMPSPSGMARAMPDNPRSNPGKKAPQPLVGDRSFPQTGAAHLGLYPGKRYVPTAADRQQRKRRGGPGTLGGTGANPIKKLIFSSWQHRGLP